MSATNVARPRLVDMPDAELLARYEAGLAAGPDVPPNGALMGRRSALRSIGPKNDACGVRDAEG